MGDAAYGEIGARMTALALGLLSGWVVLHFLGVDRRWPWRVSELDHEPGVAEPSRTQSPRSLPLVVDHGGRAPRDTSARTVRPDLRDRPDRDRHGGRTRSARRAGREIEVDLPVAVDLLHVAVSAGHSLHTAVEAVGAAGTGPVSRAMADAHDRFARGSRLVDELAALPDHLGGSARPLSTTLVVAASSGTPLAPTLQRLADAERRRLRRRTEERVRRLPVLLLAPLIGLVLPAFVLLTVVPVAITTARTGLTSVSPTIGPDTTAPSPDSPSSNRSTP